MIHDQVNITPSFYHTLVDKFGLNGLELYLIYVY